MAIIYQKNPSALIPQGNRTVSTFPSGLVRVDQSFIGRTNLQATHRSELKIGNDFPGDHYPAIDGLKIYPEAQEKRLADGFTEYIVSAYGRTTTKAGDLKHNYRRGVIGTSAGFSFLETIGTAVVTENQSYRFLDTGLVGEYYPVRPYDLNPPIEGEGYTDLYITSYFETSLRNADSSGNVFSISRFKGFLRGGPISFPYNYQFRYSNPFLVVLEKKNYGHFNEMTFRTSIDWSESFQTSNDEGVFFG